MEKLRYQKISLASHKLAFFPSKPISTTRDWNTCRIRGQSILSSSALLKLEWIIFYHTLGKKNATVTADQFGITRKTFHKWLKRFKDQDLTGLEEQSTAPQKVRKRQISFQQRVRIRAIRNTYSKYGKMKIMVLYKKEYGESISSWKIQKVIESDNLYPNRAQILKRRRKQAYRLGHKKHRITTLVKERKVNFLWHVDTIILTLSEGGYRYLVTAIDEVSKIAYARLYTSHSSRCTKDFLERLAYLTENKVVNLHHDNGSEFRKEFEKACESMGLPQWYSRPYTPKDNAVLERFNRTIQEEFMDTIDIGSEDVDAFNKRLLDWLIEYNFRRPHQALDYQTPLEYLDSYYPQVLPRYSSSTTSCNACLPMLVS